jgi:predicted TIM-barrel fold metal-dependent hydrolase
MTTERLISSDSHVQTTHDAVKRHLASKFHDEYDAVVNAEQRAIAEKFGKERMAMARMFTHEAWGRPGHHDPNERLKDMDRDGVDAEVLYCEVGGFRIYHKMKDCWREAFGAFNDTLVDFASVNPKRLLVSYQIPLIDIDHAVKEVERLAPQGARSVQLPSFPADLGLPDYHDHRYDPLWSALQETGIPISHHLEVKTSLGEIYLRDPTPQKGIHNSLPCTALAETLGFWILTGTLERFPRLKIVLVEPGLAWIPFQIDVLDSFAKGPYDFPGMKELPSFYFHRNFFLTFVDDARGVAMRHDIGLNNIMWSTDYPHPATSWPHSREIVDKQFQGVPAAERYQLVCGNAARVYGL